MRVRLSFVKDCILFTLGFVGHTSVQSTVAVTRSAIDNMKMNQHDCVNKTLFTKTDNRLHLAHRFPNSGYRLLKLPIAASKDTAKLSCCAAGSRMFFEHVTSKLFSYFFHSQGQSMGIKVEMGGRSSPIPMNTFMKLLLPIPTAFGAAGLDTRFPEGERLLNQPRQWFH